MSGIEPVPGSVVVVGERAVVEGYSLAGARVIVAEDPDAVRRALRDLPPDAAVVILTRAAAAALHPDLGPDPDPDSAMMDTQVVVVP